MTCSAACKTPTGQQCHCAACHNTFSGITLFDKHQDVNYGRAGAVVQCKDPHLAGLAIDPWGTWRTPQGARNMKKRVTTMRTGLNPGLAA
jgi:hypothetical protein